MSQKTLFLGGARSGKSRLAMDAALTQIQTEHPTKKLIFIATAQALDGEMQARIEQHQQERAQLLAHTDWQLVETPIQLAATLTHYSNRSYCLLIDCLTLWVSNCLHAKTFDAEQTKLLDLLPQLECDVILVSNQVGSGVVPLGQLSREFVDASGHLHQALANLCQQVILVVAGLPLTLKTP